MTCDRLYIEKAVAALDDDLSSQIDVCIEVLKTEADLLRRRVAENRYLWLAAEQDRRVA